jgi:hypothetical protein
MAIPVQMVLAALDHDASMPMVPPLSAGFCHHLPAEAPSSHLPLGAVFEIVPEMPTQEQLMP